MGSKPFTFKLSSNCLSRRVIRQRSNLRPILLSKKSSSLCQNALDEVLLYELSLEPVESYLANRMLGTTDLSSPGSHLENSTAHDHYTCQNQTVLVS